MVMQGHRIRIVVKDVLGICLALLCGHLLGQLTRKVFDRGGGLGIREAFDMLER
jgi:hypothetical protein